jgi:hypothetical protein
MDTADDTFDDPTASTSTQLLVVASVDVDTDQTATFTAFTDDIDSRWLGVPVTIVDGRFAATM